MLTGIDISKWQGAVNWDKIKASVGFAIVRAGYGGGGRDEQFARNWSEARRVGIPHCAYFFAYPGRSSGAQQARDFFGIVGSLQPGESIALDMENEPSLGRNLVASDVQWALDFLNTCQALFGVKPLLYINSSTKSQFNWSPVKDGDYGLWIANYGVNNGQPGTQPSPAPWSFWAIWQYTSKANLAGISPVDANLFNGDTATFLKYGKKADPPPPPPPPLPTPSSSPSASESASPSASESSSPSASESQSASSSPSASESASPSAQPNPSQPDEPLKNWLTKLFEYLWELLKKVFKRNEPPFAI